MYFNMWNFQAWFNKCNMPNDFEIYNMDSEIKGIRIMCKNETIDNHFALISGVDKSLENKYTAYMMYNGEKISFLDATVEEVLDEANKMIDYYNKWEQNLLFSSIQNGTLNDLLELSKEVLPFPIAIIDKQSIISYTNGYGNEILKIWNKFKSFSLEQLNELIPPDSDFHSIYVNRKPTICISPLYDNCMIILSNLIVDDKRFGKIIAYEHMGRFHKKDINLMEVLTKAVCKNIELHKEKYSYEIQLETILRESIKNNYINKEKLSILLKQIGWNEEDEYTVFRIETVLGKDSVILDSLLENLNKNFHSICCFIEKNAVILVGNISKVKREKCFYDKLFEIVSSKYFVVGQSHTMKNLFEFKLYYRQAEYSLKKAKEKHLTYVKIGDVLSECVFDTLKKDSWMQSLVHPSIRHLKEIDKKTGSDLSKTLYFFLLHGCNFTKTAKELGIHRNTLIYRISKINEEIELDIYNLKDKYCLLASFYIIGDANDMKCGNDGMSIASE